MITETALDTNEGFLDEMLKAGRVLRRLIDDPNFGQLADEQQRELRELVGAKPTEADQECRAGLVEMRELFTSVRVTVRALIGEGHK